MSLISIMIKLRLYIKQIYIKNFLFFNSFATALRDHKLPSYKDGLIAFRGTGKWLKASLFLLYLDTCIALFKINYTGLRKNYKKLKKGFFIKNTRW